MNAEYVIKLEKSLLDPENRKNIILLDQLLHDDLLEIGSSGRIYNKSDVISRLPVSENKKIEAFDFTYTELSETVLLLKFKTADPDTQSQQIVFRSSIWKYSENHWKMIFHQGTPSAL